METTTSTTGYKKEELVSYFSDLSQRAYSEDLKIKYGGILNELHNNSNIISIEIMKDMLARHGVCRARCTRIMNEILQGPAEVAYAKHEKQVRSELRRSRKCNYVGCIHNPHFLEEEGISNDEW